MTNGTAENGERPPGAKMTIQVYKVRADGTRTERSGVVAVPYGGKLPPLSFVSPPCACPIHRAAEALPREEQPEPVE
ncbi:hypothetical protein AB0P32_01105 [Streptomyces sp. NPDC085995]|uniref:hypothetical protein n=1 Tax=Streptomyces sp. NPDC085995 TaxID=3154861 RepID=UPI00344123B1